MMLEGSFVTLGALAWLFLRLAEEGELKQELIERGVDPQVAQPRRALRPRRRSAPACLTEPERTPNTRLRLRAGPAATVASAALRWPLASAAAGRAGRVPPRAGRGIAPCGRNVTCVAIVRRAPRGPRRPLGRAEPAVLPRPARPARLARHQRGRGRARRDDLVPDAGPARRSGSAPRSRPRSGPATTATRSVCTTSPSRRRRGRSSTSGPTGSAAHDAEFESDAAGVRVQPRLLRGVLLRPRRAEAGDRARPRLRGLTRGGTHVDHAARPADRAVGDTATAPCGTAAGAADGRRRPSSPGASPGRRRRGRRSTSPTSRGCRCRATRSSRSGCSWRSSSRSAGGSATRST